MPPAWLAALLHRGQLPSPASANPMERGLHLLSQGPSSERRKAGDEGAEEALEGTALGSGMCVSRGQTTTPALDPYPFQSLLPLDTQVSPQHGTPFLEP